MRDLSLQKMSLIEICSRLSSNRFVIKQDFLIQIEEMINKRETLREEFMRIKNILCDKKLSWDEIIKLKHFLADTIPQLWQKNWESTQSTLLKIIESLNKLFGKKSYIDRGFVLINEPFASGPVRFFYYLDGQIFYDLLDSIINILNFSDTIETYSDILDEFILNMKKIFNFTGLMSEITKPYVLFCPLENGVTNPMHPEYYDNELNRLKKEVKKFYNKLLTKELIDLSNRALNGLNEFLDGEKLEKESFPMENFFLGPKKGTIPIFAIFKMLEKKFS